MTSTTKGNQIIEMLQKDIAKKKEDNEWRISEIKRMARQKEPDLDMIMNHIMNIQEEKAIIFHTNVIISSIESVLFEEPITSGDKRN